MYRCTCLILQKKVVIFFFEPRHFQGSFFFPGDNWSNRRLPFVASNSISSHFESQFWETTKLLLLSKVASFPPTQLAGSRAPVTSRPLLSFPYFNARAGGLWKTACIVLFPFSGLYWMNMTLAASKRQSPQPSHLRTKLGLFFPRSSPVSQKKYLFARKKKKNSFRFLFTHAFLFIFVMIMLDMSVLENKATHWNIYRYYWNMTNVFLNAIIFFKKVQKVCMVYFIWPYIFFRVTYFHASLEGNRRGRAGGG